MNAQQLNNVYNNLKRKIAAQKEEDGYEEDIPELVGKYMTVEEQLQKFVQEGQKLLKAKDPKSLKRLADNVARGIVNTLAIDVLDDEKKADEFARKAATANAGTEAPTDWTKINAEMVARIRGNIAKAKELYGNDPEFQKDIQWIENEIGKASAVEDGEDQNTELRKMGDIDRNFIIPQLKKGGGDWKSVQTIDDKPKTNEPEKFSLGDFDIKLKNRIKKQVRAKIKNIKRANAQNKKFGLDLLPVPDEDQAVDEIMSKMSGTDSSPEEKEDSVDDWFKANGLGDDDFQNQEFETLPDNEAEIKSELYENIKKAFRTKN